jgi:hypothetical protein
MTTRTRLLALLLTPLLVLAACGGSDDGDDEASASAPAADDAMDEATDDGGEADEPADDDEGSSAGVSEACDLTEPDVVAEIFGASVDGEEPGTSRNCDYLAGSAVVSTFYYGTGDEYDGIKGGYEDNRGPLTDVPGIGDDAFNPGDVGASEIVVHAGDVVFAVTTTDRTEEGRSALLEMATRIAGDVG